MKIQKARELYQKKKTISYFLSEREFEIANLLVNGFSNKEIGNRLSLVATTVSTYKLRILTKINCKNTLSLSRKTKKLEVY